MAEPASFGSIVGLVRWFGSIIATLWHKFTGADALTQRLDKLDKTAETKFTELASTQAKATEDLARLSRDLAYLQGQFSQFANDIDKQDARIDDKIRTATWDEVQRLSKLRQELEDQLAALKDREKT
jgi:septal ring factor EnvC (AmiA/AmiB activator)